MKPERKKGSGGKREGAGKKPQYDSPLVSLNMMVPELHKEEIRKKFRVIIDEYKTKPQQ